MLLLRMLGELEGTAKQLNPLLPAITPRHLPLFRHADGK
jgi:hypothetical protein